MSLLPDVWNCGLRMRPESRECIPCHRGLAIPTCITALAWCTCRSACQDCYLAGSFEGGTFPALPVHAQLAILRISFVEWAHGLASGWHSFWKEIILFYSLWIVHIEYWYMRLFLWIIYRNAARLSKRAHRHFSSTYWCLTQRFTFKEAMRAFDTATLDPFMLIEVLPHTSPWVPGFWGVRKICISNAGTHGHTHQFSQSG